MPDKDKDKEEKENPKEELPTPPEPDRKNFSVDPDKIKTPKKTEITDDNE